MVDQSLFTQKYKHKVRTLCRDQGRRDGHRGGGGLAPGPDLLGAPNMRSRARLHQNWDECNRIFENLIGPL